MAQSGHNGFEPGGLPTLVGRRETAELERHAQVARALAERLERVLIALSLTLDLHDMVQERLDDSGVLVPLARGRFSGGERDRFRQAIRVLRGEPD